ncbi:MAG: hypothetical protein ACYDEG_11250 [bacterium]
MDRNDLNKNEINQDDETSDNGRDLNKKRRMVFLKNNKIRIILVVSAVVIIIGIYLFKIENQSNKTIVFPKNKRILKPIIKTHSPVLNTINKSSIFVNKVSKKPIHINKRTTAVNTKIASKTKVINKTKSALHVPSIPSMPLKSIKEMLKFNTKINKLSEEEKIAQLKQQIKTLSGNSGLGAISSGSISNNIALIAMTKSTALISFGKSKVMMKVGMKYNGYECLMINSDTVVLEKNHKVININLGM